MSGGIRRQAQGKNGIDLDGLLIGERTAQAVRHGGGQDICAGLKEFHVTPSVVEGPGDTMTGTDLDVIWEITSEAGEIIPATLNNDGGEITFLKEFHVTPSVVEGPGDTSSERNGLAVHGQGPRNFAVPSIFGPCRWRSAR